MIPLSWLFLAWLILVGLFCLLALLTLAVHLRYGVAGFLTYASALLFIGVAGSVFWMAGSYLQTVDWTQSVDLTPMFLSWFRLS